jgi:hypothetical protein
MKMIVLTTAVIGLAAFTDCSAQTVLFEDTFDRGLSDRWQPIGLDRDDYRVRDGALELRIKPDQKKQPRPMLRVELPFATSETVEASVEVTVVGEGLQRGELAGLCLTDKDGESFTVRKTNVDGFFIFAPGEVDFIGKLGEEGDPGKYTVKYWPAAASAGAIRIIVRGQMAYFQVGPSVDGKYMTFFHSAIREADKGLGFALIAAGGSGDGERWVRFDNFRVIRH